ncbi:MAG: outer membrane protein assembly factor BamE [Gammaproteobacteria bacterium AqS3]|nr:outer membrane protein assembly factor BamE [Gammaproteobacteria bacterium AqS3]
MRVLIGLMILIVLAGCATLKPYRVTVTQGNLILEKMADQLRIGMTPDQVIHVLGPPMADTPLVPDVWDYIYRVERGGNLLFSYKVQIFFDEGQVSRITGLKKFDQSGDAEETAAQSIQAQSEVDLAKIRAERLPDGVPEPVPADNPESSENPESPDSSDSPDP